MRRSKLMDRGAEVLTLYPIVIKTNRRGVTEQVPDMDNPIRIRVSIDTDRQSTAELVGQIENKVLKVNARSAPVDTYSRAWFRGEWWDLASPPTITEGMSRATKHVEFILRSRNVTERVNPE